MGCAFVWPSEPPEGFQSSSSFRESSAAASENCVKGHSILVQFAEAPERACESTASGKQQGPVNRNRTLSENKQCMADPGDHAHDWAAFKKK